MNKQLKNIFVPIEIAKLAHRKGFDEWCVCYFTPDDNNYIINEFLARLDRFSKGKLIPIPTHLQLIMWLTEQHFIEIVLQSNSEFRVLDNIGIRLYDNDSVCDFEINTAITHALNLLPDCPIIAS